jgi:hypothetical protein
VEATVFLFHVPFSVVLCGLMFVVGYIIRYYGRGGGGMLHTVRRQGGGVAGEESGLL